MRWAETITIGIQERSPGGADHDCAQLSRSHADVCPIATVIRLDEPVEISSRGLTGVIAR